MSEKIAPMSTYKNGGNVQSSEFYRDIKLISDAMKLKREGDWPKVKRRNQGLQKSLYFHACLVGNYLINEVSNEDI